MIERLKKLGLSSYEAQAYLALLKLGNAEANEIAIKANIPMGRIYDVLSNIEEAHLICSEDSRPRRYMCSEPALAMEQLSKNKKKQLTNEVDEIETLARDLASALSSTRRGKISKGFWTAAMGDESIGLIKESILGAKKELLFFIACRMRSERIKKDISNNRYNEIIDSITEQIKNGAQVKVILNKNVDFSSIEDFPPVKQLLMHVGNGLESRLAAIPATPFDIIDGENVILQMQNPLSPEEIFMTVNIKDTNLAEELRKKFFTIWEKAELHSLKSAHESPDKI